jgi:hypothetical protein
MQSIEWLQKAGEALGNPTARALAARIGMNEATLSQHKSGRARTLNDEHCIVVAEICGMDPAIVIADQLAERASTPAARKIYQRLGKLATAAGNGVAAGVLATICLALPNKSDANQIVKQQGERYTVYYVK